MNSQEPGQIQKFKIQKLKVQQMQGDRFMQKNQRGRKVQDSENRK